MPISPTGQSKNANVFKSRARNVARPLNNLAAQSLYPMRKLSRQNQGFTLIEILVVITIAAILVGAVVINLDFRNPSKTVLDMSRRTSLLMQLTSDQAVYARQQFGIRFHPESYTFFALAADEDGGGSWEVFPDDRLKFEPPDLKVEFEVELSGLPIVLDELEPELDAATDEDPIRPHVMFLSNGEIVPDFRVILSDGNGDNRQAVFAGEILPIEIESVR